MSTHEHIFLKILAIEITGSPGRKQCTTVVLFGYSVNNFVNMSIKVTSAHEIPTLSYKSCCSAQVQGG
jgi:hypothetical protein